MRLTYFPTLTHCAFGIAFACLAIVSPSVEAGLIISHGQDLDRTLGGYTFGGGSVADYDAGTDIAIEVFDGDTADDAFSVFRSGGMNPTQTADENVDAIHMLADGRVILSTAAAARLPMAGGGFLDFEDGDLVLYDIVADEATMFLDGTTVFRRNNGTIGESEEIDAFSLLPNGHYLLSTNSAAILGSNLLSFRPHDVVAYDPINDLATLFISGFGPTSIFRNPMNTDTQDREIDSVHALPNGNVLLTTSDQTARLPNGMGGLLEFTNSQIVEWNPVTMVATLYFDGDALFTGGSNTVVDAVAITPLNAAAVPEPISLAMWGLGASCASVLALRKRRSSKADQV